MRVDESAGGLSVSLDETDAVFQEDCRIVYAVDAETRQIYEVVGHPIIPDMKTPVRARAITESELKGVERRVAGGWELYRDSIF